MIKNIQILRAWASIIVVLYHSIGTAISYNLTPTYFSILGNWGVHGIDIFFVISGFIMYYIQYKKNNTPKKFIKDRMIRIVPIYWILTTIYLALYYILPNLFRDFTPSLGYIFSSYLFSSTIFYDRHPILSYGWTLEYEAIFYIVFTIVLFFYGKKYFILVSALLLSIYFLSDLSVILLEFILGMVLAKIYLNDIKYFPKLFLFLGILLLIYSITIDINEVNRLFYFGLPAVLIIYGFLNMKEMNSFFLLYLGAASYSIYLIHVFTLPLFFKIFSSKIFSLDNDFLVIISVIFTVILGVLFYKFVEIPVTNFLKNRLK